MIASTIHILFIWTVVASGGTQFSVIRDHDWRWSGEFATKGSCESAAAQLALKLERFRCVPIKV